MTLQELLDSLEVTTAYGDLRVEVLDVTDDSRLVKPGSLFVAIRGERVDGHRFVPQVQEKGAVGVVVEEPIRAQVAEGQALFPVICVPNSRKALGLLAARLHSIPSSQLTMIGVTGTNGKTTVTHLAKSLLEAQGHSVGLLGTVGYSYGEKQLSASHTTPGAVPLQGMLAEMVTAGMDVAVMEVSSHALAMDRVAGCEFDIVVFTNLTQDHLDFHSTFDQYFQAKKRLFTDFVRNEQKAKPKRALINADDPYAAALVESCLIPVWTYGIHQSADISAEHVELSMKGTTFSVKSPCGPLHVTSQLVGEHNVSNMLAAIGIGLAMGMSPSAVERMLASVTNVPGRFERIQEGQPFTVVVDYAHTEDALHRLLLAAKAVKRGRVITVFGCGGDRDPGKRPKMGQVAVRESDWVVLTSDNPRTENPRVILQQIEMGIRDIPASQRCSYEVIADRAQAIIRAIDVARHDDLVLIAGKGHEDYQILGTEKIHFDDREVAREAIRQRMSRV
ncbi:MAG: UDP-N-acetylmuramoyl-L-alanyl-D-glutamate--2,6-diaminopimelate ligase [Nitrospira sp.]|nr:UDP-N-acetylmuramoyl-L-alanyl-D-glutamate--2,6-diaminopimelate ligase [Nitrospira sp.]MCA9480024.1 UDP-N-acetylmuramoyl-L-alanyl-D-glutamate--2,6-diaminopimelate ligase [Nitrospira sp.]HQU28534.1 UDP-N-acetylmuramoyl-L-alanyl-D-glutamate--2,6-diaminopimelate ligase [Nitrospirales bacterium]